MVGERLRGFEGCFGGFYKAEKGLKHSEGRGRGQRKLRGPGGQRRKSEGQFW